MLGNYVGLCKGQCHNLTYWSGGVKLKDAGKCVFKALYMFSKNSCLELRNDHGTCICPIKHHQGGKEIDCVCNCKVPVTANNQFE